LPDMSGAVYSKTSYWAPFAPENELC